MKVLAINRAENQKVLTVKIVIPDFIYNQFKDFCITKFSMQSGSQNRKELLTEALADCYSRLGKLIYCFTSENEACKKFIPEILCI